MDGVAKHCESVNCMLEDRDLAKIIRGQLQALKASLLLEVGRAGKVWDLPSCARVVTAAPCSQDPYTSAPTAHLHAGGCTLAEAGLKEGTKREGLQLLQTPLQIQGEPLSLSLVIQIMTTLGKALPIIAVSKVPL